MQANDSNISIFNIGEHKEAVDAGMFSKRGENPLFDPKVKQAGEQLSFIIRPVPYVHDPVHSMASKNFYAFQDQLGVFIFDSRTSFNRPADQHYEFCEASDLWLKFRNSQDPNIQNRANFLRLQRRNYCYVVIIAMPSDPTLVGQMKPMPIPMEMVKTFDKMSNPSDQDIALGAVPVQPFDIMNGKNLKCSIVGHMQDGVLMRKWTVEVVPDVKPLQLPIGPNNTMISIADVQQEQVVKFFEDNQTIDLQQQYGYHEPTIENKRRAKNLFLSWTRDVPALAQIVNGYFPELTSAAVTDVNAMQPAAQPVQPAQTTVVGGDPMAAPQPAPQPAQPAQQVPVQAPGDVVLP